jgi:uncharacterized membrane protein YfcA
MELFSAVSPLTVVSGFLVGMLVGVVGVGGGSLMTPLLILLFGMPATTAVGTDLLQAATTKSVGSIAHMRTRTVDWRIAGLLALGSLPGSVLTIVVLHRIGVSGGTSPWLLTTILGITLLLSATAVIARPWLGEIAQRTVAGPRPWIGPLTTASGFVLGVLVTITSIGGGSLGMPLLVFLYSGVRLARLVGTDIAHAVPLTLVAGLGHWFLGSINWPLMLSLLLGSIPGVVVGSSLSSFLPERLLRPILAAVLLLAGWKIMTG